MIIVVIMGWIFSPVLHSPVKQIALGASQFHKIPARISANYVPRQLPAMNDPVATQVLSMNSDAQEIKKEYQKVAYSLAQKIDQSNLEVSLLDEWSSKLDHDEFMQKLPKDVREEYENLEKAILKIKNHHLREDGMTESFFTKYQLEIPRWLQERRQELNAYTLPGDVARLVLTKASESEITDNDVDTILRRCGKKNTDCVDKAFALLIDANHAFNDDQFKRIQEYL